MKKILKMIREYVLLILVIIVWNPHDAEWEHFVSVIMRNKAKGFVLNATFRVLIATIIMTVAPPALKGIYEIYRINEHVINKHIVVLSNSKNQAAQFVSLELYVTVVTILRSLLTVVNFVQLKLKNV